MSLPSEWDEALADRKAIFRAFPQAVPITYHHRQKGSRALHHHLPAGHANVQGYVQLVGQGKYTEAVQLIRQRLPLPGVLGRVCPHPCEGACRRAEVDSPVAIRELKRFAADQVDLADLPMPEITDREKRVAVIGGGPAGLTVADDLRLNRDIQVTVFDALPALGGMLRVGIPDYRLPPDPFWMVRSTTSWPRASRRAPTSVSASTSIWNLLKNEGYAGRLSWPSAPTRP